MTRRGTTLRSVTADTTLLLLGNVLRMLFTMAFVVYAARQLGVESYGKFALTQNLVELMLGLCATGLGILVTRETARSPQWLHSHLATALVLVVALAVAAGGALLVFARIANYAPDTRLAICVGAVALVPGALAALAEAVLIALKRAPSVGIGTAAESFARAVLGSTVLLLGYGLLGLIAVLIVTRCAQLCLYTALLAGSLRTANWRTSTHSLFELIRDWRVFAFENWMSALYLSLDVVLLSLFHGEAAVGIYEAAQKLIRLGSVVARCVTTAAFPYITRLYVDARDTFREVNVQSTKYFLAAILPVVITISLLSQQIVEFVYGSEYAGAAAILQIIAWLLIPQFLNPFLSHVLFARGQQRRSLMVAAIALSAFLVSALLMIPRWGATGTAYASLIAAMAALACYLAFVAAGNGGHAIVIVLLRQMIAGSAVVGFVVLVKGHGIWLPLLAGGILYAALLVLLRVVRVSDFKLLHEFR